MDPPQKPTSALFQVFLRLRPPPSAPPLYPILTKPERYLTVEVPSNNQEDLGPTHITLNPPNDNRRRAVEKFAFTKVFEEDAGQLDLFRGTGVISLVEGVLGSNGDNGRDGLLATLGVTGSGKTHTILGSRNQRGLTQLALDLLFRSLSSDLLDPTTTSSLHASVAASDPSEAQVLSAQGFLENIYPDPYVPSRTSSRAATPMIVRRPDAFLHPSSISLYPKTGDVSTGSPKSIRVVRESLPRQQLAPVLPRLPSYACSTSSQLFKRAKAKSPLKGESMPPPTPRRNLLQRPSVLPQAPDISYLTVPADHNAEYAVVISMYEVYNDRIFDLLTPATRTVSTKDFRRRPLLFKPTEHSPDRKVVAGLRKVICGTVREALMVLEAGLHERRVAGTGSNSVSSRSHGFFCVEVKKRRKGRSIAWDGSTLTIVDLAGSERARDAKTQGATLAEAGKINESLMYLGQCLQMQSDLGNNTKPNLVPFRQCKLTELLFSNSFPSASAPTAQTSSRHHRNPQKAIMIVTADPVGDFNATSQILRYSALAREVTVPRIPSVTSTILGSGSHTSYFSASGSANGNAGRHSPTDSERETMEIAALEIARMSEEIDGLRYDLGVETERRMEAEAHLLSFEDRIIEIEMEVREECFNEMEAKFHAEMEAWKARWVGERERLEEHVDRKLDILSRGIEEFDDGEDKENSRPIGASGNAGETEDLRDEAAGLRQQVLLLQRELHGRSPSKRSILGESRLMAAQSPDDIGMKMKDLRLSSDSKPPSPTKKMRKLTTRKWDLVGEDEML